MPLKPAWVYLSLSLVIVLNSAVHTLLLVLWFCLLFARNCPAWTCMGRQVRLELPCLLRKIIFLSWNGFFTFYKLWEMQFLCREVPFLLAWPVIFGILKRFLKTLVCRVTLREGRRGKRECAVSGGADLCMLWAVDPSTSLASAVRQLCLGKLQVRKVWNKSGWFSWGQGCSVIPLRDGQPSGAGGCCAPPALPWLTAHQGKGWGALVLLTHKIYFKA